MKIKKFSVLSSTFLFISTVLLSTIFIVSLNEYSHSKEKKAQIFSIAVISFRVSIHPQMVIDSYINELNLAGDTCWDVKIFDAKGDHLLLQSMINEVVMGGYDLIYTIGSSASTLTQKYLCKRNKKIPLLFSGILDHVWDDWKKANPNIKDLCSGIYGSYDWARRIQLLKLLLPKTRHAIIPIPSNSNEYCYENIVKIKKELERQGIKGRIIDIENKSDGVQKLRPFLANTDLMILQREVLGLGFLDLILELASRAHVPTYSADIDSVYAGSTMGLGLEETVPGVFNAKKTKQILLKKKLIKDIPVDNLNEMGSRLMINEKRLKKLNPDIDPRLLFLANKGFLVNKSRKDS